MQIINAPHASAYVAAWKKVKSASPETLFNVSWGRPTESKTAVLKDFQKALQNRINCRGGKPENCDLIPAEWIRDYIRVHDKIKNRVAIHQFETKACKKRFAHLLS